MTPQRIALIERAVLALGLAGMAVAVAAFDWRLGLFLASLFLAVASLDIRWSRP